MGPPFLVLTQNGEEILRKSAATTGSVRMNLSRPDEIFVVDGLELAPGVRTDVALPREYEALGWGRGDGAYEGQWVRSDDPQLAILHSQLRRRLGAFVELDVFANLVPKVNDPGSGSGLLIVHHPSLPEDERFAGLPEFTAWQVTRSQVMPLELRNEPDGYGPIQLARNDAWPLARLASSTVTIVGTGSIGSSAAQALSDLGIGEINLVDDDRLLWHNVVRHRLGPGSIGRFKVNALASQHDERTRLFSDAGKTTMTPYRIDVLEDADLLHELALNSDVVLCCADGIAPRRVVNHVSRIAGVPAIFACVLEDGRFGELFRSRPGRSFGCLSCHRAWLADQGAIDPEASQEAAYGTGTTHKPMTAAPHDLALVGTLAAKVTMSTVLESRFGDSSQRLPSEHAVIGLRADEDMRWPFSVDRAGEIVWNNVPPPRPDCATCSIGQ